MQLHFKGKIENKTAEAIKKLAPHIKEISQERIRDEFIKIIESKTPAVGIILLEQLGLLKEIIPELVEGKDVKQNKAHSYDVFVHSIKTLEHAASKEYSLEIRLASLFHDIGKTYTKYFDENKKEWTFHNHEVVGTKVTKKILERMKFPKKTIDEVTLLVRWHMFFSDVEQITLSAVRRMVARVGEENIWDLINLRKCDRIGTGRPKEQPYRLRKYVSLVEEVMREPITPGILKIDGTKLMKELNEKPSRRIGNLLHILLSKVLDNPKLNSEEELIKEAKKLSKLKDEELAELGEKGRIKKMEEEEKEIKKIRDKNKVN